MARKVLCFLLAGLWILLVGCQHTTIITLPNGNTVASGTTSQTVETTVSTSTETTSASAEATSSATAPDPTENTEPDVYDISGHVIGDLEKALFSAVSEKRDIPAVLDPTLCALAAIRSYETSILYSSSRPDGREDVTVLSDYGIQYTGAAVRVLRFTPDYTPDGIVRFLQRTEAGKDIFSTSYTAMGIGTFYFDGHIFLCFILIN